MLPNQSKKLNHLILCLLSLTLIACTSALEKKDANAADIYLQLGIRYLSMNKLEVAKENLERALQNDSDNAQAHNALAVLYEKLNQFPEAKDQYETALKLTPDDLGVQNNFGRFLCEHGEPQKGMELLNQAATNPLNEKQWLALTNAGRCQLTMGQEQKGKAYFKQALQVNDTYAPALLEMQKISYQNGEYWPAKGYLQKYLSVADHTSETLWYAIHTERALGNNDLASEYQNLLLEKFPLSNEAKKIGSVPR